MQLNVLLSSVNLSWNGFGADGMKALGDALKVNSALLQLDILYVMEYILFMAPRIKLIVNFKLTLEQNLNTTFRSASTDRDHALFVCDILGQDT